ncbi:MAG: DUF2336 domain-containing protein [Alphaproteobacteria bacterium]|nr:MAG: DUF2336 domain-containing protein [Alphaproteobacteria bacterium]
MTTTQNVPVDLLNLVHLAETKSAEGRNELFGQLSNIMIDGQVTSSDQERAMMVDILNKLLHEVEMQVRQSLSSKLARDAKAPKELVVMLANDTIDVARPILLESDLLNDDELLEIIKHRTQEHQMAVAMRENVSEVVSSALVETGQEDVVTTLLQNPSAQISQATLEYLVEQSERVDSYQTPLLSRADLKPDLAKKMYVWVSDTLRKKIVADYKVDPATIEAAMLESVGDAVRDEGADSNKKTMELVEAISKTKELTPGLLAKTLRDGEIPLFVGLFSKMVELDIATMRKIIFEAEGEVIALACKAIGFENHQFSDLYKLIRITRSGSRDVRINEMSHLLSYYEQMKKVTAQNILRSWQRDSSYLDNINKGDKKQAAGQALRLNKPGDKK